MRYETEIEQAMLATEPVSPSPALATAWTRLQSALTAWLDMGAIASQSMGTGPSIAMQGDALAMAVAVAWRVYRKLLADETAEAVTDQVLSRPAIGHSFNFSTRPVW